MNKLATTTAAGCAALVTAAAATLGGTASAAAPDSSATPGASLAAPTVKWGGCANERLKAAKAQCALVSVPLDYAKPTGKQVQLAVSRLKATASPAKRQGPLLVNPGGPGGSGLRLPLYLDATLPKDVRSTYDLIGFDPRGVGDSVPALSCDQQVNKGPRPDYEPSAAATAAPGANETAWLARSDRKSVV